MTFNINLYVSQNLKDEISFKALEHMNDKIKLFLTVLGLYVYQSPIFAQTPNYTGTWILNLEKSTLEHRPNGLTSSMFIIQQEGNKFRLTRYHIFGDKKKKINFKMVADAKTRRVKLLFKGKLEQKENNLQATLWRKNFLNIVNYKFGNSRNEFIADEIFTGKPRNHHNIWVFDREIPK
ncbi:MAG TPA: hypothetical protein VKB95_09310 [Chitinophagaceae bacterium]|nr:hypothetical protein [Chitinophagaceae bacterium]